MSVSSHLTPDPERRLRITHESITDSLKRADWKLALLTLLAAMQLPVVRYVAPESPLSFAALLLFCAALPIGVLAFSPFVETPKPMPLLDPSRSQRPPDSLLNERDISGHSQLELVNFLDRYLGGGITATPYYEDIVARIVMDARTAARKNRLLECACVLSAAAQLCLLAALIAF